LHTFRLDPGYIDRNLESKAEGHSNLHPIAFDGVAKALVSGHLKCFVHPAQRSDWYDADSNFDAAQRASVGRELIFFPLLNIDDMAVKFVQSLVVLRHDTSSVRVFFDMYDDGEVDAPVPPFSFVSKLINGTAPIASKFIAPRGCYDFGLTCLAAIESIVRAGGDVDTGWEAIVKELGVYVPPFSEAPRSHFMFDTPYYSAYMLKRYTLLSLFLTEARTSASADPEIISISSGRSDSDSDSDSEVVCVAKLPNDTDVEKSSGSETDSDSDSSYRDSGHQHDTAFKPSARCSGTKRKFSATLASGSAQEDAMEEDGQETTFSVGCESLVISVLQVLSRCVLPFIPLPTSVNDENMPFLWLLQNTVASGLHRNEGTVPDVMSNLVKKSPLANQLMVNEFRGPASFYGFAVEKMATECSLHSLFLSSFYTKPICEKCKVSEENIKRACIFEVPVATPFPKSISGETVLPTFQECVSACMPSDVMCDKQPTQSIPGCTCEVLSSTGSQFQPRLVFNEFAKWIAFSLNVSGGNETDICSNVLPSDSLVLEQSDGQKVRFILKASFNLKRGRHFSVVYDDTQEHSENDRKSILVALYMQEHEGGLSKGDSTKTGDGASPGTGAGSDSDSDSGSGSGAGSGSNSGSGSGSGSGIGSGSGSSSGSGSGSGSGAGSGSNSGSGSGSGSGICSGIGSGSGSSSGSGSGSGSDSGSGSRSGFGSGSDVGSNSSAGMGGGGGSGSSRCSGGGGDGCGSGCIGGGSNTQPPSDSSGTRPVSAASATRSTVTAIAAAAAVAISAAAAATAAATAVPHAAPPVRSLATEFAVAEALRKHQELLERALEGVFSG
jgi:hypothetical protein